MSGSTATKAGVSKKYTTVGTIRTIDLSKHTFTLEPIARYRFQVKDDDETSWMIILKEDVEEASTLREGYPLSSASLKEDVEEASMLGLVKRDVKFVFDASLTDGLIVLKQNKTRISVKVGSLDISKENVEPEDRNEAKRKIAKAINDSAPVEIEIL